MECDGGTQERNRPIAVPAQNGGAECAGNDSETQDCNTDACPGKNLRYYVFSTNKSLYACCLVILMKCTLSMFNLSLESMYIFMTRGHSHFSCLKLSFIITSPCYYSDYMYSPIFQSINKQHVQAIT